MEQGFLARLDRETRRVVEEIEAFAATEIEVRPTPVPSRQSDVSPKAVMLLASEQGATLLYRDEDAFRGQAVLHELLHLHRYWVERVPQLVPAADPNGEKTRIANQIENALEHLIIVPREAGYGFNPYPFWNETAKTNWQAYPWAEIDAPWARRKHALLSFLTTSFLVTDTEVKRLAERALRTEGLLLEAEKFAAKIARVLESKERCIGTAVRFLRVPSRDALLAYLEVRDRKIRHEAIRS